MKKFLMYMAAFLCLCTVSPGEALAVERQDVDPAIVAGCWGCIEEGDYVLDLNPDQSFTGYFDGEAVSGQWQLESPYPDGKTCTLPLHLSFDEPGDKDSILALAEGLDPEKSIIEQTSLLVFELDDRQKELHFSFCSSGYYAAVEDALALSGEWISSNLDYSNWYTGEEHSTPTTDYSVSFGEGNSVHAVLMDGEITGRWELSEVVMDMGYANVLYDVYTGSSNPAFHFQMLHDTVLLHTGDYSYTMLQMDEQAMAEFNRSIEMHSSAPLGHWPSISMNTTDFSSYEAVSKETRTDVFSITFNEDGTVHALLDREYTGTWAPLRISRQSNDLVQYSYDLQFDGVAEDTPFYCYLATENSGRGKLYVSTSSADGTVETIYVFSQSDDTASADGAQIAGYWKPEKALWYNDAAKEFEPQDFDADMYVDACENGTFRANFPLPFTGTWSYDGTNSHSHYLYSLTAENGITSSFVLDGETLIGWYDKDGRSISVYFEKGEAPEGFEFAQAAAPSEAATDDGGAEQAGSGEDIPLEEKLIGSWTARDALIAMEEVKLSEFEYRHFVFSADGSFEYAENGGKSFCGTWTVIHDDLPDSLGLDLAAYGLDDFVSVKVALTLDDGSAMELSLSEDNGEDRLAPLMLTLTEGNAFTGSFYYFTKN